MRNVVVVLAAVVGALCLPACHSGPSVAWFEGDLDAALAAAADRQTVVMAEFYTDWCSWCRRLEADTLSDPEVRSELARTVNLKLDAEGDGAELAARFGVDSYPTIVFLDFDGREVDRILGYLPPDSFLRRVQRVRSGDTFLACLRELDEDPGNVEVIERTVNGLLERSDPEGAISRIEAFHRATGGDRIDLCRPLMFAARSELHSRVYQRAGALYRRGWDLGFEVPDTAGTGRLHALLENGLSERPADQQAELLRSSRYEDAGTLLEIPDVGATTPEGLLEIADFAYRNGHYEFAGSLYRKWFSERGEGAGIDTLNDAAWRLYQAGVELETASAMAHDAFARSADPEIVDTLARILYVTGRPEEAIALETTAAERAEGSRRDTFYGIAEMMAAGEPLGDRPAFESYPGSRRGL